MTALPPPEPHTAPIPPDVGAPWWRRKWWKLPVWGWGLIAAGFIGLGASGATEEDDNAETVDSVVDTATPDTEPATTVDEEPAATDAATTSTSEATTTSTAATTTTSSSTTTTSSSTSTTEPPPAQLPASVERARTDLAALTVADPDPARSPYERDDYDGDGWGDADGDCISTRYELLIDYSLVDPVMDGCRVVSGEWLDAYTLQILTLASEATIDHVVPLAEAHRAGAWRWDNATKNAFANDEWPGHLVITAGDVNQSKADKRPDEWLPPNPDVHCRYAVNWITSKSRYELTVTAAEADALAEALDTCTPTSPSGAEGVPPAPVIVITTPTTTTTTTIPPSSGAGVVELLGCNRRSEEVTIGNTGGEPVSLSGYVLHDEDRNHETGLGGFGTLAPGQQLIIMTGPDAFEEPGRVVWKRQNVWNNDGDTAFLIDPAGGVSQRSC